MGSGSKDSGITSQTRRLRENARYRPNFRGAPNRPGEAKSRSSRKWKVPLAVGTAILMLLGVHLISYRARTAANESLGWVRHTNEVLENLQDLRLATVAIESSYRGFALTGDKSALESYGSSVLSARQHIAAIRNLTGDNPAQERRIAEMEKLVAQKIQFGERVITLRRTKGFDAAADAVRTGLDQRLADKFNSVFRDSQAEELRLLKMRDAEAATRLNQTKITLIVGTTLGMLIVIAAGWSAQRDSIQHTLVEQLLANEESTSALLDLTHDAIFVRDLRNEITFWNKGAESLYGWSKEEALGKAVHELLHTILPAPLAEIEAEALRTHSWEGELIHQRRDGTSLTVSSRWVLQMDDRGRPVATLETNRDLSQRQQEEKRFLGLMDSAPDAMVVVNPAGDIVLLNVRAEEQFGYHRDELLRRPIDILIPERYRSQHSVHLHNFFRHPQVRTMGLGLELFGLKKDGTEFPAEIMLSPFEGIDGILVTAAIRDITERKQVEEALRQSEERSRMIVSNAKDYAILMLDPEGAIVNWNEGAERIYGYKAEEIIGQHFSRFYSAADISNGKPAFELEQAARTGLVEDEGWRIRKNGSRFFASVMMTALQSESGELRGFGKITRDITERKKSEERLEKTLDELKRSNDELQQFAYVASHDLQEPLRMVASYTQLLARRYKGQLDTDADEFIEYAVDGCNRMQGLIQDLLAYSRSGTNGHALRTISCEDALDEAISNLQMTIKESDAIVTHDTLPSIQADDKQLALVFQNLIGNGIKYRSDAAPRIHVSATKNGNREWIFSVRDNGLGIERQYFERIFILFQRLHGREEFKGTGIGLAICKKIVERLGGRIWVESQPKEGSTFYFSLPESEG